MRAPRLILIAGASAAFGLSALFASITGEPTVRAPRHPLVVVNGADGIYVIDTRSTVARRLNRTGSQPRWSPDGARILFLAGAGDIWVMRSDGSRPRRLTHTAYGYPDDAVWSPDGQRIAYSRSRGYAGIYVVNADGSNDHVLEGAQLGLSPAWSPDGHQIAFSRSGDIYVIDADGGDVRQLTQTGLSKWVKGWSKGGRILFKGFPWEGEETDPGRIYVIDDDGSREHLVSSIVEDVADASWIPGEETIAYVVRIGLHAELHTVRWNGGDRRKVMDLPRGAWEPDWHPAVRR